MALRALLTIAALLLLPAAVPAADTGSGEHRLTAEQVEQVLRDAATRREKAEQLENDRRALNGRSVRGEIGVSVGTHGYREAFGSAVVPLGSGSSAAFTFDTGRAHGFGAARSW